MMRRLFLFLSLLVLHFGLFAQPQNVHHFEARQTPAWFREGLSYQLMPRSFSEEGTLKGAEKHLERLQELGVTVIYLTPVNVADTISNKSHGIRLRNNSKAVLFR